MLLAFINALFLIIIVLIGLFSLPFMIGLIVYIHKLKSYFRLLFEFQEKFHHLLNCFKSSELLPSLDLSQEYILIELFLMITLKDCRFLTYSNTQKVNSIVWLVLVVFDLNFKEETENHFSHNQMNQVTLD